MNRTATLLQFCLIFSALTLLITPAARAESDYEFASALIKLKGGSFSTDDLVERLAARLEETPANKSEATLIRAALKRSQAGDATPEKRVKILKEAGDLYQEVVAGDKKFRLYDTAQKDSEAIRKDTIFALIESSKDKPAEAKKYRAEAAAMFGKEAQEFKNEAEAYYPKFKAAHELFLKKRAELNPKGDEDKMPGRDVMEPLEKNFDGWIIADKKYVALRLEQVEAMDETDGNRKKLGVEMIEHCKKRIDDEVLMDFPVITSRYSYLQGRFYSAVNDEESAKKSWKEAMEVEIGTLDADQKKQILGIRKLIIHDLVKMLMKGKKYSEVEELMLQIKVTSKEILKEDAGKELMIDYAKAVAANAETAGDYEKALKELHGMLRAEAVGSMWANSFSRAMADVLLDARAKKVRPHLTAQEWYDAARGFHLMGRYIYTQQYEKMEKSTDPAEKAQAPAKFEEAYKEYSNAVDYYRRAIAEARQADRTDLAVRLDVEPKAWFEMGLSYMRMKHDYEAIIAYKAMRDSFLPESRKKWMPDPKKDPKTQKQVEYVLKKLDLPKEQEGMLAKSGINILIALDNNEKTHKDPWNVALKPKIITISGGEGKSPLDPDGVKDQDYIVADGDAKSARSLSDSAKKEVNPENADTLYGQAFTKFVSAAEKFAKVKPDSSAYDFALVQIANNYTQAQQIVADGRGPNKTTKAAEEQNKDLAAKALNAYKNYEAYVDKNPTKDEKVLARRSTFKGLTLLAKNSLYTSSGNWEEAIKSADDYLAWENETSPPKSSAQIAYLNKFRAYLSLSAANQAPASDPFLKGAEAALTDLRSVSKDTKLNTYVLSALSDRYNIAAFQLEYKIKGNSGMEKSEREKLEDMITRYERKVADLQGQRVDLMENTDSLTLDDYSRLVYLFNRVQQTKRAADIAVKLLQKFDPENKNMKMPDNEETWKPFLDGMLRAVKYDSLDKDKRCKQEHTTLVDFMYDTAAGAQLPENDPKRPPNDRYNVNMEKALEKISSIRNPKGEYADCQTIKVGPKPGGKPYLTIVEEEVQFRRKIVAARDLLSDMALEVADKLRKEGNEEKSNEYLAIAKQQIEILKELNGQSAAIEIKVAEIDIALGKPADAMNRLSDIKNQLGADTMLYFVCSRRISELYALQGKWKDATEFPEFIAVTAGFNNKMVKERWPGMEDFLKSCYEHGVKMPDAIKKKFEAAGTPVGEAPKTETPEAPKAEAPKVEAPKADVPKADAPKADAPQAEAPKTPAK